MLEFIFARTDCCTNMWNLWYCTVSAFCVLSMLVCWMLVGWTCGRASKRIGSLVLQVIHNFVYCWVRHLLKWTGVDVKSGSVYCSECNNFIYHSKLDALYLATIVAAEEKQMGVSLHISPSSLWYPPPATHKESFKPWSPSLKDIQALEGAEPIACQGELFVEKFSMFLSSTGRRGLLNLGQTCFLNVVLQCLAHNPLLRNYFLSDKHNCRQCKIEHCTSCEMDKLFTEVFLFFSFSSANAWL